TMYHKKPSNQAFSISTIFDFQDKGFRKFKKESLLKFNLSAFDENINFALLKYFKNNKSIILNDKKLLIENVVCENIDYDFLEINRISKAKVKFITPTTFRVNPCNYPLPEPRKIFKSLNRSYRDIFGDVLLSNENLDEINRYVALEGLNINTDIAQYKKFAMVGFTGEVTLNIKFPDEIIQQRVEKLLALIPYVGVGYKTGMGMGKCIILKK
ncbi:MAG: CRISPR-associated endoribonuclease Cas6, partial [Clostridium sp.]